MLIGLTAVGIIYLPVWHGDAAIYLPYVRSLWERGRWMEFNLGEMSSGATSPLWLLWLLPWYGLFGVMGLKVAGGIMVLLAVLAAYGQALRIGMSVWEALLPAAVVAYCVAPAGFLGYETPLAALVSIAWAGLIPPEDTVAKQRPWVGLMAALTPLVRPEMAILVGVYALVMLFRRRCPLLPWLLVGGIIGLLYYGWMHLATGSFSASSYCRSFALREMAELRVWGFSFHLGLLMELLRSGLLFVAAGAVVGGWFRRAQWQAPQWQFMILSFIAYALFFTLVAPVNAVRYLAPVAFSAGSMALWGLERLGPIRSWVMSGFLLLLVLNLAARTLDDRRRGYEFERVTERECAEVLNTIAEPGATVLVYEVQIRWWLKPELRVLSLDGVIDGKVAPYLDSGDLAAFLWRYRPQYWIANEAVWRRPFLRRSFLAEVLALGTDSVERAGIRFVRLYTWPPERLPRGFYGCLALYRLSYTERGVSSDAVR
ncbi:MAG: hypothetical protein RMJ47_04550 [Bacteroidota bacterium]|nr:hypothetical protein [Bacteroidota bacterium]